MPHKKNRYNNNTNHTVNRKNNVNNTTRNQHNRDDENDDVPMELLYKVWEEQDKKTKNCGFFRAPRPTLMIFDDNHNKLFEEDIDNGDDCCGGITRVCNIM